MTQDKDRDVVDESPESKKERVLHTRVPAVLELELKKLATNLRVPIVPGAGFGGQVPATIFRLFMTASLEGQPSIDFPPGGPVCSRGGAYISPAGRSATPGIDFPTSSTERRAYVRSG